MKALKTLVAASAIALSFGGAAFASDSSDVGNPGMLLYQNGTILSVTTGSKMHTMIMAHAKPYTGGVIYASGGHLYTVENARMADGKMLYDAVSPGNPNYMAQFNR